MTYRLSVAYHSEQGRRAHNEDMYGVPRRLLQRPLDERGYEIQPPEGVLHGKKGYLFLLADGVGGYRGGDLASRVVVEGVAARYYADPSPDIPTSLQRVIEAANRQLWRERQQPDRPERMSTTLVAVVIYRNHLFVAGVGDSRVYLIRDQEASLLTNDHSWVQRQLDRGQMTPIEAATSPHRNRITRSLGSHSQVGVDIWQAELASGDRVLLCSDGISNYLEERELIRLACQPRLQQVVNHLIDTAYDRGSSDNMSAVLIAMNEETER